MITTTQTGRASLLRWLKRTVAVTGGLYLVLALFIGIQVYLKGAEVAATTEQLAKVRQDIGKADAEIRQAKAVVVQSAPSDLSAVAKLQLALENRAAREHCDVAEFRASSDLVPYLTRFAKTSSSNGWGQVEVQATLTGTPKSVLATIAKLPEDNVPYEFDSIEIKREHVSSMGDATVSAHVVLRVLIRTDGGGK